MSTALELSAADARRIALAAQGFASPRPARPGATHLRAVAGRLHAVQLDTVSTLVRAHYLPFFSRLGPYPTKALDKLVNDAHALVEMDAHQASLVPVELEPLLRWRVAQGRRFRDTFGSSMEAKRPGYIEAIRRTVVERGPLSLADLDDPGRGPKLTPEEVPIRRRDGLPYAASSLAWGRNSDGKAVLDWLVRQGVLVLAGRGRGFERLYDMPERVLPETARATKPTPEEDARRELVRLASKALGVATSRDLAQYFAFKVGTVRGAITDLVEECAIQPVRVDGWKDAAYLAADVRAPKRVTTRALLGPFDSLTWNRDRTHRLFGFDYTFEIYVPAPKRRYGYYVLPFLAGENLVARVDLKAERASGQLLVLGAYAEAGVDSAPVASDLADELAAMARWLGLERVSVAERGDLAKQLTAELG